MSSSTAQSVTVMIANRRGLHARASAKFCAVANSYDARVTVSRGEETVNGGSIMGLLTLAASRGTELVIRAEGPQAEEAIDTLTKLVADLFGEGE